MNRISQTPFRLSSTLGIVLIVGLSDDIISYIDGDLDNKQALIASAVRRDGKMAAVIHITDDYEGNLVEAKEQQIPTEIIEAITRGLGKNWTGFHLLAALKDGVKTIITGELFSGNTALQTFGKKFFDVVFTKDGFVAGSRDLNELLLIGPRGFRKPFAWLLNDSIETPVFELPVAFEGDVEIRNTVLGRDALVCVERYSNYGMDMSVQAIADFCKTGKAPIWNESITMPENFKFDDISTSFEIGEGRYVVLCNGMIDSKPAIQQLTAIKKGDSYSWSTTGEPTLLDEKSSQYGSVVRFTETEVDLVVRGNGMDLGTLTRMSLEFAPAPIQRAVKSALELAAV